VKKGDYVFVVKPAVMSGDKRPSLAKIIHVDEIGGKALVESTYRMVHPHLPDHSRWVVPVGCCVPVEASTLRGAAKAEPKETQLRSNDLVMWVDKEGMVAEGVVVNETPKTVEILEHGTIKVMRKKKGLVVKI